MAGDDERKAILRAHGASGARRTRTSGERRELAVRDDLASRDRTESVDDRPLERCRPFEVELDVAEVHERAGEERAKPLDQRIGSALRSVVSETELVLHENPVRTPDLAHAPSGHGVARLDDGHRDHSRIAAMSAHGFFIPPHHDNEPILSYAPGTPERAELQARLRQMENERISLPMIIGGKDVHTKETFEAVEPHRKSHVLADVAKAVQSTSSRRSPPRTPRTTTGRGCPGTSAPRSSSARRSSSPARGARP